MSHFETRRAALFAISVLFAASAARAAVDWQAVDAAFGFEGKVLPGDAHRYGWPRSDLDVTVDGVKIAPALALGSWAGFVATGGDGQVMAMGDLVLRDDEVGPTVTALEEAGFEVTAIHNHLLRETPRVAYVHFMKHGEALAVARGVRSVLAKTATPMPSKTKVEPTPAETSAFAVVQRALGRTGSLAGHVLQVSVPRAERIEDNGMEVPASLGLSTAINVEIVGERVATTGDFVLVASEVNPVVRELTGHGFEVTAIHSHMLGESPRLFFLHFWGLAKPQAAGEALAAALGKVATKPAQ
jgi:hypothetical protein